MNLANRIYCQILNACDINELLFISCSVCPSIDTSLTNELI